MSAKPALAANPTTINFQGKVVNANGTNVTDGTYSFVFRIYNTATPTPTTACGSDAACLFEETQGTVSVTSGTFQVELGSSCAGGLVASNTCTKSVAGGLNFNTNNALYLTLQFNGDVSGTHGGFMWPVIHLTSVPYAFYADNAGALGGLASSAFAQLAQADAFTNSVSVQPATNVSALTVKQNSNGSPTADILDIQTQNGTGVITVTGPALNEAAVTITSVGATRDLTLGSASGIIKFSAATTTLQKAAASFTLDVTNAGASTLNVSNSNGANVASISATGDIAAGSAHVFKVGATSGSTISACSSSQFIGSQAVVGGIVTGGSCTSASTSLANAYNASGTTGNTIALTSSGAGVLIQDNSSPIGGNLFAVQKNAGTVTYLGVTATGINIQSNATGSAVNALAFDTTTTQPHLKIYGANGTNYADIYYDSSTSTAYYGANTGTAVLGSGTGPVNVTAGTGAAFTITGNTASTISTTSGNLTLDANSGFLVLGANTSTLQKSGTSLSLDVNSASNSTLTVTNGGAGTASLSVEGNVTAGTNSTYTNTSGTNSYTGAGAVTLQGGTTVSVLSNTTNGVTIDSGTTGAIGIGNVSNTNAKAITIGNTNSGTTLGMSTGAVTQTNSNTGVAVQTNTNSATAFQVTNSASNALFGVDTSSNNSNNLLLNPSIETGGAPPASWTAKVGSGGSTPTQVTSTFYDGGHSMQVVTSGTATNAGVTQSIALSTSTTYALSVYVNSLSGFVSTAGAGTFDMGFGTSGADTSCLTAQKVPAASWTRLTCSFTTPASLTTPYIYFKQTDATPRTFFIDSAVLETDANATSKWQDGKITLNGTIVSPVIISPLQDSSNVFLVQNSEGINILGVDTTDTNLVPNPGLEVNTVGWTYSGTQSNIVGIFRDTSSSYLGVASLKFIMSAAATDQARFTFNPSTLLQAGTTYTLSFYAKDSATSYSTLTYGRREGAADSNCTAVGAINTNWQRYSCSFTWTTITSPYIYISAGTASKTISIDAVSLEPGSTLTPYGSGSIYLNGVITSPTNFQNKTDSTAAFQIMNSTGLALFGINTAGSNVNVGVTGTTASASNVNIASTSGNATQTVLIGANGNTSNAVTLDGGTGATGIQIGNSSTAHGIQIGANAAGVQTIKIGNMVASSALTLGAGSGNMLLNTTSGTITLQTTTAGAINITPAAVDGTNIVLGTSDTVGNQLVLDTKTSAGDPTTGVNGGMYYNSSTSSFRCFQGSAWRNCLGVGATNQSTATQGPLTVGTDTYLTGSLIPLPTGGLKGPTGSGQDGSKITWHVVLSKTAAGTGASTLNIRVGTNGTTADTARCTAFGTGTPTTVADGALLTITVYATAGGSTATLNCSETLTHELPTTGFAGSAVVQAYSVQTSFDSTPAGTKIGLSLNAGTAEVITVQSVDVTTSNL